MDREPIVAGTFYPADPKALKEQIDTLLGTTQNVPTTAVIAPHGGLGYCGDVAAEAFRTTRIPSVVILLGPNHMRRGHRASIMTYGTWKVPGARVSIDRTIAEELRGLALLTDDQESHAREYSLETLVPFLVRRNPRVRIVPICLGDIPHSTCMRIGNALADVVNHHGRDVLIVASTNLSHDKSADDTQAADQTIITALKSLDDRAVYEMVQKGTHTMCGYVSAAATLIASRALGGTQASLIRYTHSGMLSDTSSRAVGYAALVFRRAV